MKGMVDEWAGEGVGGGCYLVVNLADEAGETW